MSSRAPGRAAGTLVHPVGLEGVVGFVGEGGTVTIDVSTEMIRKQLTIMASWTFSAFGQAECARFVAERGIDVVGRAPGDRVLTNLIQDVDFRGLDTTSASLFPLGLWPASSTRHI